jgi:hypothetical protein
MEIATPYSANFSTSSVITSSASSTSAGAMPVELVASSGGATEAKMETSSLTAENLLRSLAEVQLQHEALCLTAERVLRSLVEVQLQHEELTRDIANVQVAHAELKRNLERVRGQVDQTARTLDLKSQAARQGAGQSAGQSVSESAGQSAREAAGQSARQSDTKDRVRLLSGATDQAAQSTAKEPETAQVPNQPSAPVAAHHPPIVRTSQPLAAARQHDVKLNHADGRSSGQAHADPTTARIALRTDDLYLDFVTTARASVPVSLADVDDLRWWHDVACDH